MSTVPQETAGVAVEFLLHVFSADAVKRAAYVLMHRATVTFQTDETTIRCLLRPTDSSADDQTLERDFRREVLDQELRLATEAKTESLRNAILGLAFSRTGLQE